VIATLTGTITGQTAGGVVVDVGGVGLYALVPTRTLRQLREGEDTHLFTTLVVREDDMSLYGFAVEEDRQVFDLLRSVSGVGPKSALGVLSEMSASDIAHAITREDDKAFTAVSGIGPKTGKLIIVSLSGKISHLVGVEKSPSAAGDNSLTASVRHDIVTALMGLGWSEKVAGQAVDEVAAATDGDPPPVTELIRRALALLGPKTATGESR
jgi:Holliday junction DNA helicase RuvA